METLGDRIKKLRNHLTQEELASMLQVDRSTLASWEINRREPDIRTLCRLASFFNVSVDWLAGCKEQEQNAPCSSLPQEKSVHCHTVGEAWEKVIDTANRHGITPDQLLQFIELTADIAAKLQPAAQKQENSPL